MGAWIEIDLAICNADFRGVAPLVGAWIEILLTAALATSNRSLPSWERGLKSHSRSAVVAPLVGAWIEIQLTGFVRVKDIVAPLVGAWIEICNGTPGYPYVNVAPLVGAWIEITARMIPA